jgi:hypothetical protein
MARASGRDRVEVRVARERRSRPNEMIRCRGSLLSTVSAILPGTLG